MILPFIDTLFAAIGKGLQVWDHYNKTEYYREFKKINLELYEEMSKPIYPPEGKTYHYKHLRDQSKIDRLHLDLVLLINSYNRDVGKHEGLKPDNT